MPPPLPPKYFISKFYETTYFDLHLLKYRQVLSGKVQNSGDIFVNYFLSVMICLEPQR